MKTLIALLCVLLVSACQTSRPAPACSKIVLSKQRVIDWMKDNELIGQNFERTISTQVACSTNS